MSVAVVLKGYPRLSETFIAQEIRALERMGLDLRIVSLRHPTDKSVHPVHREIEAPVTYLPEYLYQEPLRVLRAWWALRRRPGYRRARRLWLKDLLRDRTPNRVRRFGQALVLAHELDASVTWLYAHFLHTPASVARYAAVIRGLPWSVSAHAKDIWTSPEWEKREKLADAAWAVTCTAVNRDHLSALAPPDRVKLVYHGLDLTRFPAPDAVDDDDNREGADGGDPKRPVVLLSVGRLVAKKGYGVLLDALARLPGDLHWNLVHIGGGGHGPRLREQARRLGIADRIDWRGAQPQEAVIAAYKEADLFVLASRIAEDGDRDGLPNVLMEAQSQNLAVVASDVSAIPELLIDGQTGWLVPPDDVKALAEALARAIADPLARQRLGRAGGRRVRTHFDAAANIDALAERFGLQPRAETGIPATENSRLAAD